ncbi:MAG: ROK family protein [Micromonosporaceae bacterium]|nr:ROK family protein [Micromonosporaceae bacterium]
MRAGPSQEEIRRQNLGALLRQVHLRGALSRAELTSSLGLNRSTIGALTADLSAAGLVREELPAGSAPREGIPGQALRRAGRPSLVVRPQSERVYAYAFALGAERITAARVGLGGQILDRREAVRELDELSSVQHMVRQMQRPVPRDAYCIGAGAATTATDRADEPLGAALAEVLGMEQPVSIANRADLGALAEHTRGCATDAESVIYLHGDVGVAGGIIAGGRLVTGHGGYAGEVGHMVVNPNGRPCACGSRGCWETEIGEQALLRAAGYDRGDGAGGGRAAVLAVVDAAARGDAMAQAAVRHVGDWLGFGVANLVNIFNPETVIFGGTLREVFIAGAAQVRSRINRNALLASRERVRLRTPELGEDAPLIGAAELAFQRLLADPLEAGAA